MSNICGKDLFNLQGDLKIKHSLFKQFCCEDLKRGMFSYCKSLKITSHKSAKCSGIRGEAGRLPVCEHRCSGSGREHPPPPRLLQGQLQRGQIPHLSLPQVNGLSGFSVVRCHGNYIRW